MKENSIIKTNTFTQQYVDMIINVKHICEENDNVLYDVYLGEDNCSSPEFPNIYMYFSSDKLIGYITVSYFSDIDINAYACVLPDYRYKGIFTLLLNELNTDIQNNGLNISSVYFPLSIHHNNSYKSQESQYSTEAINNSIHYLTKRGYTISNIEYKMCYDLTYNNINNDITISSSLLKKPLELLVRKYDTQTSELTFWVEEDFIGSCMIYSYNNSSVCIFSFEIAESLRGKGYGKHSLYLVIEYLYENNFKHTFLHVSNSNKKACSLYKSCGFKITEEINYYNLT